MRLLGEITLVLIAGALFGPLGGLGMLVFLLLL